MFNDQLVTVWSAPNYCYRCGNVASILEFADVDKRTPKLFDAVPDSERVIPTKATTPYFLWSAKYERITHTQHQVYATQPEPISE